MPNKLKYELRFAFNVGTDEEAERLMEQFSLAVMKERESLIEMEWEVPEVFRLCLKNEDKE